MKFWISVEPEDEMYFRLWLEWKKGTEPVVPTDLTIREAASALAEAWWSDKMEVVKKELDRVGIKTMKDIDEVVRKQLGLKPKK